MKKLFFLLCVFALGLLTSCQKEEFLNETLQVEISKVSATICETAATRTQLSSNFKVLWSKNDAISVLNNGKHYRFIMDDSGDGKANADFSCDLTYGTITGGIETSISKDIYVGVFPFSADTKVSKNGNDYVINTVIPATQAYSINSFGQSASPMVAVNQYTPDFSFKNVGSMVIMPLKGDVVIKSAVLTSKSHKIAGAATITAVAENNWIPTVDVTNGESQIVLSCGEGVQLKTDEATKFHFVLAPGTYEKDDLSIKFIDSYGNFFETTIPAEITYVRSEAASFQARTFEAQGTEELDLWVKANASAYMDAERIIPSVKDVDVVGWITNLKNQPNTKALIEEAISYITLKNYKAAYEVLGGVPGFVKDTKHFEATGSVIMKVDYSGTKYITSMLEDIANIDSIESLLAYLNEFDALYEAYGIKAELNKELGTIGTHINKYLDAFIADNNYLAASYMVEWLQSKKSEWGNIMIVGNKISKLIDSVTVENVEETLNAIDKYGKYIGLNAKEAAASYVKAAINTALSEIMEYSFVESLEKIMLEEDTNLTSQIISYIFSQEKFMETVKTTLYDIVETIENASKEDIDDDNLDQKTKAINTTVTNTLIEARKAARNTILSNFDATNDANLNNGPWGTFKKILNLEICVNVFTENDLLDVYNKLVDLCGVIDEMITYDRSAIYYDIKELSDYQENVDWWVLTFNEEIQ